MGYFLGGSLLEATANQKTATTLVLVLEPGKQGDEKCTVA